MPDDRSAAALLREVGLLPDGPVPFGRPLPASGPGVFVVELPAPRPAADLDLAKVGKWLERVPELTLDGVRPSSKELAARLAALWLPEQPVLLVGSAATSATRRLAAIAKTVPGDRKPAWTGFWLHLLRSTADLRCWWAVTDAPEEYEEGLADAFAGWVGAEERARLWDASAVLPWAALRTPAGTRKRTGLANQLLPEPAAPAPRPVTRIVELPAAEADGARDEARRGRRPAPGRGAGRIASAAAYAAQGSPRKAVEEVRLSPEGHARLTGELAALVAERPAVVRRIATAREHGDLKENAEYHAAREEQGLLEARIRVLEAKLKHAVVVAPEERGAVVELGSRVRVETDGEEQVVTLVSAAEARAAEGRISSVSPVGAALMGRRVGDAVTIRTPGGEVRYAVLAIE